MFIIIISITVFGFVVVRDFGLSESVDCFPSPIFVYIPYHKCVRNMIHNLCVFFFFFSFIFLFIFFFRTTVDYLEAFKIVFWKYSMLCFNSLRQRGSFKIHVRFCF